MELAPTLPIIVVSGFADSERLRAERELSLLSKPFGIDELGRAIAQVRKPSAKIIPLHKG